jgi:hypothetical protein
VVTALPARKDTSTVDDHLQRAREFLAIAEKGDSKREAYKAAAEEVAAAIAEGMTPVAVATALGKSRNFVRILLAWHESGYKADTPWLMDKNATTRAAISHTKKVIREGSPEQLERIIAELPDLAIWKLSGATSRVAQVREEQRIERIFAGKINPSSKEGKEKKRRDITERIQEDPSKGFNQLYRRAFHVKQYTDLLIREYREFLALVDDEHFRESARECMIDVQANVSFALGEAIEGGFDKAFARLLEKEKK